MTIKRREYEAIVSASRVHRALHSATPNETVQDITPGQEVLVYDKKVGWDVPYTFLYRSG